MNAVWNKHADFLVPRLSNCMGNKKCSQNGTRKTEGKCYLVDEGKPLTVFNLNAASWRRVGELQYNAMFS